MDDVMAVTKPFFTFSKLNPASIFIRILSAYNTLSFWLSVSLSCLVHCICVEKRNIDYEFWPDMSKISYCTLGKFLLHTYQFLLHTLCRKTHYFRPCGGLLKGTGLPVLSLLTGSDCIQECKYARTQDCRWFYQLDVTLVWEWYCEWSCLCFECFVCLFFSEVEEGFDSLVDVEWFCALHAEAIVRPVWRCRRPRQQTTWVTHAGRFVTRGHVSATQKLPCQNFFLWQAETDNQCHIMWCNEYINDVLHRSTKSTTSQCTANRQRIASHLGYYVLGAGG